MSEPFDDPERQAKYEAALKEIDADLQQIYKEIEDAQRVTEKDLAIIINAR